MLHHTDEDVVSCERHRTQKQTVRIYIGPDQEDRHAAVQESNQPVIVFHIFKEEVRHSESHESKPEEIGDDEYLQERDVTVQCGLYHMIFTYGSILQPEKYGQIYWEIKQRPYMLVLTQ